MAINNLAKAEISYRHQDSIQALFKENILGELHIQHFSINVFFGTDNIFLSPTPQMAAELCKKNFVNQDSNYKRENYSKYTIYPWRAVEQNQMDAVINHVKEEKFQMRQGMMIVRNLGDERYVMYSFATHKKEARPGLFYFLYHCKANYIAQLGDWMYSELHDLVNEYTTTANIYMPKIVQAKAIELEPAFANQQQQELYHHLQAGALTRFSQLAEQKSKGLLHLVSGGKIAHPKTEASKLRVNDVLALG